LLDKRAWTFWQYTDRGRLDGYSGEEKLIDLNVFYGSNKEFSKYGY
jgi:lysozyme